MYIYVMKKTNPYVKGSLNTIILKLLSDADRMYGYEITKKVKEITNGEFQLTEGALYPALHKLETDGLIVSSVVFTDNRPRKYYSLTKSGKKQVSLKLKELAGFIENMQQLLNLKTA